MRTFETGATRDTDEDKLDYEGFLNPLVLEAFAQYMHKHRKMADGSMRDSDNWQKGIPREQLLKSLIRHLIAVWKAHRKGEALTLDDLCGVLFNTQGLILDQLKENKNEELRTCFDPSCSICQFVYFPSNS